MQFIDTHQHLILRERIGYAWTAGVPALAQGDFTLADYRALTVGKGIAATIFMETGVDDADYQTEVRVVAGLIGQGGMVAQIASCRPETDAGFDDWLAECAGLGVCGFRRILHEISDNLSQTATFRRNLRKIGALGLPFDLCFLARQLPIAYDLALSCDDQIYVLDHCGVPDIAGGAFDEWAHGITRLASLPHLRMKLSGITRYCAPGMASVAALRPWVDHVMKQFGPSRVVWGSDWPVCNMGSGLPGWIDMTLELLADLSTVEQSAVAHGTAAQVYGVSLP